MTVRDPIDDALVAQLSAGDVLQQEGPVQPETAIDTVAVVGMGYVGLPTALALSESGFRVLGLDRSQERLDAIRAESVDLLAADHARLQTAVRQGDLLLTSDARVLHSADAVIVCVPTPIDEYLMPDLRPLSGACQTVVTHAHPGQLLILTSTTYVGTTHDLLVQPLTELGFQVGTNINVAFSPERIDPGNSTFPQSVVPRVVGGSTPACAERAAFLLRHVAADVHLVSSAKAAEMTKLLENTFRAVNIALANEFATASSVLGLEVTEVIGAAATKPYGFTPFYPGPGVGGHCIPCDPHYLLWQLRRDRVQLPVVEQAMTAIAHRPLRVVDRVRELLAEQGLAPRSARVLLVGVTYKPGVEDVRESPAIEILSRLRAAGCDAEFWDELSPPVRLNDGTVLQSVPDPVAADYDLVVVHTLQPDVADWLADCPHVLDATYRLTGVAHRVLL
jgi:nucleotide sugar dehydrogenase